MPIGYVLTALVVAIALLDLYGTHSMLMPYYAGFSTHVGKSVPPGLALTVHHLSVIFERLSLTRPSWLSPMLYSLWIGYWIATLAVVLTINVRMIHLSAKQR